MIRFLTPEQAAELVSDCEEARRRAPLGIADAALVWIALGDVANLVTMAKRERIASCAHCGSLWFSDEYDTCPTCEERGLWPDGRPVRDRTPGGHT